MNLQSVIIKPVITEKSMSEVVFSRFTFHVHKESAKKDIKKAIEEKFKVNVEDIKTLVVKGKKRRSGKRRNEILQSAWKKAIVKLKAGQKIDLFDVGGKAWEN